MLTNTVFSLINAVYIGGDPSAQQENLNPGKVRTWGAGSDNITVIEAAKTKFTNLTFYLLSSKKEFQKKKKREKNKQQQPLHNNTKQNKSITHLVLRGQGL